MGCFLLAAYWLYSIITSRFKPIQETWSWLSFFLLLVIALEDVWWIDELFFYTNFSSNNACKNPVVFVKFPNSGSVSGAIFAWASGGKHRRFRKGCHISPKKIRVTISFFWFQAFWRSWLDLFFCMVGFFCFFFTSNLLFLLTGGVWKGEELLALEDRTVDRWRNLDITPNLERCRKSFLVDLKVIEGGGKYTLGWWQASQYHGGRPLSISGRPKISRSHLFKRIILLTGRYWKGRATPNYPFS